MFQISMLNKISSAGLGVFGDGYQVGEFDSPDAIILRSASMHDMDLPSTLCGVARAGAGTNNIPIDTCSDNGTVVFNTPGANANAVKELVLCGLFLSCRNVVPATSWAQTLKGEGDQVGKLVEKGKSQFAGNEILGKTLGVIGMGAIGRMVANSAAALGMQVIGFDTFPVDESLLSEGVTLTKDMAEIQAKADFITIHVPLNDGTKGMIDGQYLAKCKDGVRVLNFARGPIVAGEDMLKALDEGKVACYVIDFPDDTVLGHSGVVALPHLGASTAESEENCARMAAEQLKLFLETGSIKNSVNLPNLSTAELSGTITTVFASASADIKEEPALSVKKGDYQYLVYTGDVSEKFAGVQGVSRVRVIEK